MERLPPRLYLHIVAVAEDEETLMEWAKTQATIHRKDDDVFEVGATLVVDGLDGRPIATTVEV